MHPVRCIQLPTFIMYVFTCDLYMYLRSVYFKSCSILFQSHAKFVCFEIDLRTSFYFFFSFLSFIISVGVVFLLFLLRFSEFLIFAKMNDSNLVIYPISKTLHQPRVDGNHLLVYNFISTLVKVYLQVIFVLISK